MNRTSGRPQKDFLCWRWRRLIGYELQPGVAASVYLAFTLDNLPGSPGLVTIEAGTRVQSVPGQNEKPQTFETVEGIDARAEWNALLPQLTQPQTINQFINSFVVMGTRTGLNPGDNIIIVTGLASGQQSNRVVLEVVPDQKSQTTLINLIPRSRIIFLDFRLHRSTPLPGEHCLLKPLR